LDSLNSLEAIDGCLKGLLIELIELSFLWNGLAWIELLELYKP
jgi:hypothetical protein